MPADDEDLAEVAAGLLGRGVVDLGEELLHAGGRGEPAARAAAAAAAAAASCSSSCKCLVLVVLGGRCCGLDMNISRGADAAAPWCVRV